jgi:D-glycero-alpha-D-manno-heptose 1-phosphate guanylyltransferase
MTKAIILAGGLGTRLSSVLIDLPKPLAPINDKPFLEYQMDYWINQGVDHFILSVGYLKEKIIDYFGSQYNSVPIDYAAEEKPLDTGGGLLKALQLIKTDDQVLVLNGDTYFEVDLITLKKFHTQKKSIWTFSLFKGSESNRYMNLYLENDGKLNLKNEVSGEISRASNGGVYLINPSVIKDLNFELGEKFSIENDLLTALEKKYSLFGIKFNGQFIDIGIPEDYKRASTILI